MVVDAGAVFHGDVVGSASASNTLELASSASTGTISGIGSKYINFGTVTVDKGANWELAGTNSLTSGSTLRNNGTLTLSGATLSDAGSVINNGTIELDPSSMTVASLTGTGTVKIDAGSTLSVEGTTGHHLQRQRRRARPRLAVEFQRHPHRLRPWRQDRPHLGRPCGQEPCLHE